MTNTGKELAVVTDTNPLLSLRGPDGRWSARDVQKSGHVHTTWKQWEYAIKRGEVVLRDRVPGQGHVEGSFKMVKLGQNTQRQVTDYSMDEWGLLAALQKSDIPEIDLWFTAAALQALGFASGVAPVAQQPAPPVVPFKMTPESVLSLGIESVVIHPDGSVETKHNLKEVEKERARKRARREELAKAKAARDRLALPGPRRDVPWPRADGEAPWEYDHRLHKFFNEGSGDWKHVAELLAKDHAGTSNWPQTYGQLIDRVQEFVRLYPAVTHPDWGLANAAYTYVTEHYPSDLQVPHQNPARGACHEAE